VKSKPIKKFVAEKFLSFSKTRISKVIFLLTIGVLTFWLLSKTINIYYYAFVGVIFEILWLPALILTFLLPVFSFTLWSKENFNLKSLGLYSLLIAIISILVMLFLHCPVALMD